MTNTADGHIAVVGAGAWGTTLARILALEGHPVRLWAVSEELAAEINVHRENVTFLPGIPLPEGLVVSAAGAEVLSGARTVLWVVPSAWLRDVAATLRAHMPSSALMICATKGIERRSGMRMSQVLAQELGDEVGAELVVLSGPNLSAEIAAGLPAVSVAASRSEQRALQAQQLLSTARFRVYRNDDVVGVELCGALKNVIAIAAGISDGLGYGANARAALITRGLAEMTRLGVALGARAETFAGIAGMGDLVTTCTSTLSRNYRTGTRLARGESRVEIEQSTAAIAEGIWTTQAEVDLARQLGVEVPIAEAVYTVLFEGADARVVATGLMTRAQKAEFS